MMLSKMDAHGPTVRSAAYGEARRTEKSGERFNPVHVGFTLDPLKVTENVRQAIECHGGFEFQYRRLDLNSGRSPNICLLCDMTETAARWLGMKQH